MTPYPNPLTIDGPPYLRKKARKKAKEEMEFVREPPRCATCRWYNSHREGHPENPVENQASHCRFGHFAVLPTSVCSKWLGQETA